MSRPKNHSLRMESLERRELMAGDVAVSVSSGDLFINEAAGHEGLDQQVQVFSLGSGRIRVQGIGETRIQTTLTARNGMQMNVTRSYADFAVSDDIFANLGGGNDWIQMTNNNGGISADRVEIDMGGGGKDNDIVSINGLKSRSSVKVETGAGSDQVRVSNSQIGDGSWEDLKIDTGSGRDFVTVALTKVADDLDVNMYSHISENDNDELRIDGVSADDVFADMGNGDDEVTMVFSNIDDDVRLDMGYDHASTGQDDDYVFLGYNNVDDDIVIEGRDGNDEVRAAFNTADKVRFNGGSGADEFFRWYGSNGQDSNDFNLELSSAANRTYGYV